MSSFKRRIKRNRGQFGQHTVPARGNYQRPLIEFAQRLDPQPGTVTRISVCHDTWCAIYKGGYCNCNPEIRVGSPQLN